MSTFPIILPVDVTAQALSHRVVDEPHVLTVGLIIPDGGAFYTRSVTVHDQNHQPLTKGVDWDCGDYISRTSRALGLSVHSSIVVTKPGVTSAYVSLQYVGGEDMIHLQAYQDAYAQIFDPAHQFAWQELLKPDQFEPAAHTQDLSTLYDMDKISGPLEQLVTALSLRDTALHDHFILSKVPAARADFESFYNTRLDQTLSPVEANLTGTRQRLSAARQHYTDGQRRLQDLTLRLAQLQGQNNRQKKYHQNRLQAAALIKIALKSRLTPATLAPIPQEIHGLLSWWDFTDAAQNGPAGHKDKAAPSRVLSGVSTSAQGFSMASTGHLSVPFSIPAQCTVVAVVSRDAVGDLIGDIGCQIGAGYALLGAGVQAKVSAGQQEWVCVIAAISDDDGDGYFLSNATQRQYGGHYGYDSRPDVRTRLMDRIGAGAGVVKELIIYSRLLSYYEADALSTYLQIKHGVRPHLNANARFDADYQSYDFGYARVSLPLINQEAAILTVPASAPSGPFAYALAQLPAQTHCWCCIGESPSVAFWAQEIPSAAHAQLSVKMNVILPDQIGAAFTLKANGASVGAVVVPGSATHLQTLEFIFTPVQDTVLLELFQTRSAAPPVRFAVTQITVQRQLLQL